MTKLNKIAKYYDQKLNKKTLEPK